MRDIEFRAKAINREGCQEYRTNYKNGDWVYGLITKRKDEYSCATMTNTNGISNIDVDEYTLCQYIGRKDKNGTKIYEGDLVKFTDSNYPMLIRWVKGCAKFVFFDLVCEVNVDIWNKLTDECEIIGNIFDNPEIAEVV